MIAQRQLIVSAGPAGGVGLKWQYPLHIEYEAELTSASQPNKAKIQIANLSDRSVSWLQQPNTVITVQAGAGVPSEIFRGDVLSRGITTRQNGGDWITTITAVDGGRRWLDADYVASYPPGTLWSQILADIVSALRLPIAYQSPTFTVAAASACPCGWTWHGKAREAMTELLDGLGFYWWIDSGRIIILQEIEQWVFGPVPLVSPQTGLMGSPEKERYTVKLRCAFMPEMRPGRGFVLASRYVNGAYRAGKVNQKLTSDGMTWENEITGWAAT